MKKMNDEKMELELEMVWMKVMRGKIGEFYSFLDFFCFVYIYFLDIEYWQLFCRFVQEFEWYDMVCVLFFFFYYGFDLQFKVVYIVKCNGSYLIIMFMYLVDVMYVFMIFIVN